MAGWPGHRGGASRPGDGLSCPGPDVITDWWVRPGVFDTREWAGEVRVGGRWRATGMARGEPYVLEGEFLEVDPPRRLVHTWHTPGKPGTTTVTYDLEPAPAGTRITLRHSGLRSPEACTATCTAWQTSFERLVQILRNGAPPDERAAPA